MAICDPPLTGFTDTNNSQHGFFGPFGTGAAGIGLLGCAGERGMALEEQLQLEIARMGCQQGLTAQQLHADRLWQMNPFAQAASQYGLGAQQSQPRPRLSDGLDPIPFGWGTPARAPLSSTTKWLLAYGVLAGGLLAVGSLF